MANIEYNVFISFYIYGWIYLMVSEKKGERSWTTYRTWFWNTFDLGIIHEVSMGISGSFLGGTSNEI